MKSFLQHIADELLNFQPGELERTIVLFPNRRSVHFLKSRLKKNNNEAAFILPRIQGIDDFVSSVIPYALADAISVNATLFTIFQQLGIQRESFDLFYTWGEMLVQDFNDLDKYLANPNQVFRLLLGEKEIASQFANLDEDHIKIIQRFWTTFKPGKITREQSSFLALWKSLPDVYQKLNHELILAGRTYLGHAYRLLAEEPETYLKHQISKNSKFIIAGFNRITPAEAKLFSYLQKNYQVLFFWDVDAHYTEMEIHEAGYFFRKFSPHFPSVIPPQQNINTKDKKVTLYNCSKFVVQAQQTAQLIREIKNQNETIAIILPVESRLPIVLAALAKEKGVNITMGIQVRNSLIASFIAQWIEWYRFVKNDGEEILFHTTRLDNFINHPLLQPLLDNDSRKTWENILKENSENFISPNLFPDAWQALKSFLIPPTDGMELLSKLKNFFHNYIQIVTDKDKSSNNGRTEEHNNIQFELTLAFYNSLVQLINSCNNNKLKFTTETASRLVKQLLHDSRVPFASSDTDRIQIMGLIESQCLDFDHVFVLDFNEGIIPPIISQGSYIPYSIRRGFGLPTPEDHQRMYAYFFYRLLHRCKTMHLFYNSVPEGTNSCEPSRFAVQLSAECSNIQYQELMQDFIINTTKPLPIEIPKSQEVMQLLMRYTTECSNSTSLTPTALNEYLDCSLRFYFRYIADLTEPIVATDEIDHAVFGDLLHYAMHTIYKEAIQLNGSSQFSESDIKQISSNIPTSAIYSAFQKVFHGKDSNEPFRFEGATLIAKEILINYIKSILLFDEKNAPINIISMEKNDKVTLQLAGKNVLIGGKIDRVDYSQGVIRVIDYKTGSSIGKTEFSSIQDLFEFSKINRPNYIFQVMLYSYIVDKQMGVDNPIQPVLLFVRDSFDQAFKANIIHKTRGGTSATVNDYRIYKEEIENGLNMLIADLFNPDKPFSQTENEAICKNCAYNKICRKDP